MNAELQKRIDECQRKLDIDHELTITSEGLSDDQLAKNIQRVAYFGECDGGSTYYCGDIDQVEKYVDKITGFAALGDDE